MKKLILQSITCAIILISTPLYSQNYSTGFDNTTEQNGWVEYRKGEESQFYFWNFSSISAHSAPNCLEHYYPVGGTNETNDWFVSPEFDFSKGGKIDSIWHHYSGFGVPMAGDTIALYVFNGSPDPDSASWTMLINFTDTSYKNDGIWKMDSNITVPVLQGKSYIALRYTTTSNWLDVKFDDIKIIGHNLTSIDNSVSSSISIFPNPATSNISIKYPVDVSVNRASIYDASGKLCISNESSVNSIDISILPKGLYTLLLKTEQGVVQKKFLKQ